MPDPFVGWFAKEVLLQEAFSRALDLLGRQSWRWRLAGRVRRQTRTWIAGWRLRRWLGRQATWDALVHPSPEHAELLVTTLAAAARPRVVLLRPARYTQEALRGEATRVAAAAAEQFIAALEASQAVAVVDRRHQLHDERTGRQHAQLTAQLAAGHQAVLERLDAERDFDERLARLPPTVREPLQLLNELDRGAPPPLWGLLAGAQLGQQPLVGVDLHAAAPGAGGALGA